MRNIPVIAWYDVKRVLLERESLFWLFAGPLIFTLFFGLLLPPRQPQRPALAVVNQDDGSRCRAGSRRCWRRTATRHGVAGAAGRLTLVVPAGAAAAIRGGQKLDLVLHAGAEETNGERNIRFKIQKALTRIFFPRTAGRMMRTRRHPRAAGPPRSRPRRAAQRDDLRIPAQRAGLPGDVRLPESAGFGRGHRRGPRQRPPAPHDHRPGVHATRSCSANSWAALPSAGFRSPTCSLRVGLVVHPLDRPPVDFLCLPQPVCAGLGVHGHFAGHPVQGSRTNARARPSGWPSCWRRSAGCGGRSSWSAR